MADFALIESKTGQARLLERSKCKTINKDRVREKADTSFRDPRALLVRPLPSCSAKSTLISKTSAALRYSLYPPFEYSIRPKATLQRSPRPSTCGPKHDFVSTELVPFLHDLFQHLAKPRKLSRRGSDEGVEKWAGDIEGRSLAE